MDLGGAQPVLDFKGSFLLSTRTITKCILSFGVGFMKNYISIRKEHFSWLVFTVCFIIIIVFQPWLCQGRLWRRIWGLWWRLRGSQLSSWPQILEGVSNIKLAQSQPCLHPDHNKHWPEGDCI